MARNRKRTPEQYRREYERRLELGRQKGKTRAEATGHRKRQRERKTVPTEPGVIIRDSASELTRRRWLHRAASERRLAGALITVDVPRGDPHAGPGPHARWLDGRAHKYPLNGRVLSVQLVIAARGMADAIFPGGGLQPSYFIGYLNEGGAGTLDDWNVVCDYARDEGLF